MTKTIETDAGRITFTSDEERDEFVHLKSRRAEAELAECERLADVAAEAAREEQKRTPEGRRQLLQELGAQIEGPRARWFAEYLRRGKQGDFGPDSIRALGESTDSAGGFLVPQSFADRVLAAAKAYDGIFDAATIVPTNDGSTFVFPLDDDGNNVAAIVAESGTSTPVDAVFDRVLFGKCPTWRSGHVRASMELAEDAGFDLTGLLASGFGRRFARGIGASFTSTLLTQATLGKTAAGVNLITADELLDLVASVDPAHGQNGSFLMNFATFTALRKLKGSTSGDFLLPIGRDPATGRPTLFNMIVYLSPSMPNMTTGQKSVAFGDLSRFLFRQTRGSLTTKVYVERYADYGQIGYEGFWRVDGALAKPTNSPIPVRYLQQA